MKSNKKYVVSGLNPGKGGVPKLLEYIHDNSSENIKLLTPIKVKVKNRYLEYYLNNILLKIFRLYLHLISNRKIIIVHFQSVGLNTTKYLIKNNDAYLYLIDNTFFCLKSYNFRNNKECLECINDHSKSRNHNCKPLNYTYSHKKFQAFYDFILAHKTNIKFLTLSDSQSLLLKKFVSENIYVKSLYFLTNDLNKNVKQKYDPKVKFDVVFHGSSHPAKGSEYVYQLAKLMPNIKFFFPFKKEELNICEKAEKNINFDHLTWETGLQNIVQNAKIVMTPSIWSNTPEAATLKSIIENGNVFVLKTSFGFANELKDYTIQLTGNIKDDIKLIEKNLNKKHQNNSDFIENYNLKAKKFKKFFEIVN